MRNTNLTRTILWVLAAAYAVALIANISFGLSIPIALVLLVSVAFALIHAAGALRLGRYCGIRRHLPGGKQRPGKHEHPDWVSVRSLPLHGSARPEALPGARF